MSFDAVVIGAGPAGSVAARELARRGLAVLLLDKARFPRQKVCGCCINHAAVRVLRRLGLAHVLAAGIPLHEVRIAASRHSARVALPGGFVLSRAVFDAALAAEAVKAGVRFRDGTAAKLTEGGVIVNGEHVAAGVVLVASGLTGSDAEAVPGSLIGAGVSIPADAAPEFYSAGTIYMATGRGGYVGIVRLEDGRLDAAAALDVALVKSHEGVGPAAEAVLRETAWPRIAHLAELPWKGTPALTRSASSLAGKRWFTIGDAAGYIEPFTGEGMAWAIMSAVAVAPIAARAVQQWQSSCVDEWVATYHRLIGSRQRTCRIAARLLRSPTLTGIAVRALSLCPLLSRPVVDALNRPSTRLGVAT